jgi:alkanesulfonate monooxygenase SsuD/methylene tetrahydromethanopterin reductase-like flavin-dependent oxidoreductase (luciferase family)
MIVDVQFSSAHNDWPALRDAVLEAESDGTYGTTWVLDHFDGSTFPGGDRDLLEAFTFMGALAAATTTIGIGSLVANVANRHPELLALAASSVQRISNGRLQLGIGAGAAPETPWSREHRERGIELLPTLPERHAAVVHQIEVLRRRAPDVPVIVGVNSEQLARIAGTYADGVNIRLSSAHSARYLAAAREAAHESQRDTSFDCSGWASNHDLASQEKAHELGLDRLIISRLERL